MSSEVIDAEFMEPGDGLVPVEHPPANLYGTQDPHEGIRLATEKAKVAADVIRQRNLISNIQGKEHVQVEGWTTLGSLFGVFAVVQWTKEITDHDGKVIGYQARVEARTLAGAVVGGAESRCMRSERNWKSRDDYALESMAQTRATSKALRQPLGFAMVLAGYNPTPAEELTEPAAAGAPLAHSQQSAPVAAESSDGSVAEGEAVTGSLDQGGGGQPQSEAPPPSYDKDEQIERVLKVFKSKVRATRVANEMFGVGFLGDLEPEQLATLIKAGLES